MLLLAPPLGCTVWVAVWEEIWLFLLEKAGLRRILGGGGGRRSPRGAWTACLHEL